MTGARWVYATLAAFVAGFALWWPRLLLIVDEDRYVSQALAYAHGGLTMPGSGVLFPPMPVSIISNYPPGTSLLQAPFVWIGGWRMAAVASVLALILATLATMRWLRANGGDAGFALIVPGFVGAAFFGRVAMSDVPAMAVVAAAGLFIWKAERGAWWSALAGAASGLVLLFREPVLLLLLPLLVGAAARGKCTSWALAVGFLATVALRLVLNEALFGTPWHVREPGHGFSVASLAHTVPLYLLILGVLLPAGALLPVFYRGNRRADLVIAVTAYVGLFLFFEYDAVDQNGFTKGLLLTARYMAPAMPVFALLAADVWPRWYSALGVARLLPPKAVIALAGIAAAAVAFAVHPLAWRQEAATIPIARALAAGTRPGAPIVTNTDATLKYLSPAYGPRRVIVLPRFPADSLAPFLERHGALTIALLDRSDSRAFEASTAEHDRFLARAGAACAIVPTRDEPFAGARLRVFEVTSCR